MDRTPQNRHWWHPFIRTLSSTQPVVWVLARTLHHVDRIVLKISAGKHTAATILAGLPIVTVTTTGSKSGKPRPVPLIALPDGDKLVFIASNWGQRAYPGWYHNMIAHPQVTIACGGQSNQYKVHEAAGLERESYWARAVELYTGYAAYAKRVGDRHIPVMVCVPLEEENLAAGPSSR